MTDVLPPCPWCRHHTAWRGDPHVCATCLAARPCGDPHHCTAPASTENGDTDA